MKNLARAVAMSFLLALPSPSHSESANPLRLSPELRQEIQEGLTHLYNLDFEKARTSFESLKAKQADHPILAFALPCVHWWQISTLVMDTNSKESQLFQEEAEAAIAFLEKYIKENGDPTGEADLAIGGVIGMQGRWDAANRNFIAAYFKGKKAYKYLSNSIEKNPDMVDAYLGKGIFDYFVATLPAVVRYLAFWKIKGDKELGLEELHIAQEKGFFSKVPAQLFLINIYAQKENQPNKSDALLSDLRDQLPRSPFVQFLEIVSAFNHGTPNRLHEAATEFSQKVTDGTFPPFFQPQADFVMGLYHLKIGDWEKAAEGFNNAVKNGTLKSPFYTWAYLYRGYMFDVMGLRDRAVSDYNEVLNQPQRWNSWENAKKRLKHPFTVDAPEREKLDL